jgi:RNA polymerase sigma-70 factor (ECF subfamily)
MEENDDFRLVKAAQAGDEKAFESIIRRYQRQVANLIYMNLGNIDDVEDISQEVFIRVYRSLSKFKFNSSLFSWIYRIAVNLCIDEIRKRKVRRMISLDFITENTLEKNRKEHDLPDPSGVLLSEEKKEVVRGALKRLSADHRNILVLREYNDLSYDEIAETLGLSIETVKSRIFRARLEMKKILGNYFKERT